MRLLNELIGGLFNHKTDIKNVKNFISKKINQDNKSGICELLIFISDFYLNTKIREVDYKQLDSDMLLYQAGYYEGHEELFSINITRQVMIGVEDENFHQIGINLIYNKNDELETSNTNKWCAGKAELCEWLKWIKNTQTFNCYKEQNPVRVEVYIAKV